MTTSSKSWVPDYIGNRITRRPFLQGTTAGAGAAALIACGGGSGGGSGLKLDDAATARQPGTVWLAKNDWRLADETKEVVRGGIYRDDRTDDVPQPLGPDVPGVGERRLWRRGLRVLDAPQPWSWHRARLQRLPDADPGPGGELGDLTRRPPVTFAMRKGVKFQGIPPVNGRVMDIDDWKTSHERHFQVGVYRNQLELAIARAEYPDATHMVWHLTAPLAPLFDRIHDRTFAYHIMPKELNADPQIAERGPIGTGPKQLDKTESSIKVEWRKHPGYWGGDPFIDRWHEPIIKEYANRYAQFVNGTITNFIPNARDVFQLRRDAPETVIVAGELDYENACRIRLGKTNPKAFPWGKDPRVRIAIKRSIDHKGIGDFLSNKVEFERSGIPVEVEPMTHIQANPAYWLNPEKGELGPLSENFLFNPGEAKKLLAAAGYPEPFHLPYYISGTGALVDAEQLVTDSLEKSGNFNLERIQVATSVYRVNINIDAAYDGIQQQSCSAGVSNDYVMFRDYYSTGQASGSPAVIDPRIDELALAQRRELDIEKRNAIYKEIQLYWAQVFALIPGRHRYTEFSARWPWLHNSTFGESRTSNPDLGLHLQWLDASMPNRDRAI